MAVSATFVRANSVRMVAVRRGGGGGGGRDMGGDTGGDTGGDVMDTEPQVTMAACAPSVTVASDILREGSL